MDVSLNKMLDIVSRTHLDVSGTPSMYTCQELSHAFERVRLEDREVDDNSIED